MLLYKYITYFILYQQVQEAINKTKTDPKLRGLLERLKDYPNIPRKKAKFEVRTSNSEIKARGIKWMHCTICKNWKKYLLIDLDINSYKFLFCMVQYIILCVCVISELPEKQCACDGQPPGEQNMGCHQY